MPGPSLGAVFALVLFTTVNAYSNGGRVEFCDPAANYGCDPAQLKQGNGWTCDDPGKGTMPWVKRPVRTEVYTVRSGDGTQDPTTYTPGAYNTIHLRVNQFG
eukprot:CAMPEP_0205820696 /NCGR_PEP_ID=MMETSP0206-20130828/3364_1 /ASSEMBLY_ACC=CAM_ASM_000279 /TAXON_ID=36767 /ORGANISM="Euplotes focardii, Strain TN1" /LENGTH=101 /DNA_ID=CAMNT_0053115657 /DNA_START=28 /DNA_END=330 /DNA_ORIENTATION=-